MTTDKFKGCDCGTRWHIVITKDGYLLETSRKISATEAVQIIEEQELKREKREAVRAWHLEEGERGLL